MSKANAIGDVPDGELTGSATVDQTWGLDAQGNWTSVTDNLTSTETDNSFNLQNEQTVAGPHYQYDDANGNLKADGVSGDQYIYDAWNRQVEVKDQLGDPIVTYTYDALGRRVTSTPNGGSTTTLDNSKGSHIDKRAFEAGTTCDPFD